MPRSIDSDAAPSENAAVPPEMDSDAPVPTKTMTGKRKAIIAGVCIVIACVIGVVSFNMAAGNALEEYRSHVKELEVEVLASSANLEGIGNAINSSWHEYVFGSKRYNGETLTSIDDAVETAQAEQSANITKAKTQSASIDALYSKVKIAPDSNDKEIAAIVADAKQFYSAYQDFYDTVIDVSGNYSTWSKNFSDTDSAVSKAYKQLKIDLGD